MQKTSILESGIFNPDRVHERLIHESAGAKIKSLHLLAGQELPVKAYGTEGEAMLVVLSGEGLLLGKHGVLDALVQGDVVIADLRIPHGLRAEKDMCVLASFTPLPEKKAKK
ncbi:hypothetical protein [Halodesulfovibrio aestuarii]|uniref:Cupin n=1 Tax=Halodesulfovibrio aestuarii TaxID=126333 RepID=A0A8G2F6E0_9BACT|nr:hypothetical protein [Halodesulfovibrio aestuarii]SHI46919.1 hypothetical protein SAMN05660830_00041 [Halodesulfovibrio aestuarii]